MNTRHPNAIHRNQHGIYYRYLGQGRFALARKVVHGRWQHRTVVLPSMADIDAVRHDSFTRWSHYFLPTYKQAISAAEGNRKS